jgi:DNA-binding transcriptional LysR family regulator
VPSDAACLLLGPVLPTCIDRYPDIHMDLAVSNLIIDVIEGGFDAGIRYGGTVPEAMIAQRMSADIGWVVAGSPGYLDRFGTPKLVGNDPASAIYVTNKLSACSAVGVRSLQWHFWRPPNGMAADLSSIPARGR